jgi:hypothetical protein
MLWIRHWISEDKILGAGFSRSSLDFSKFLPDLSQIKSDLNECNIRPSPWFSVYVMLYVPSASYHHNHHPAIWILPAGQGQEVRRP